MTTSAERTTAPAPELTQEETLAALGFEGLAQAFHFRGPLGAEGQHGADRGRSSPA